MTVAASGPATADAAAGTLLLVLPLQAFRVAGSLWLDAQACNGLALWLRNFGRVTLALPVVDTDAPPTGTVELFAAVRDPGLAVEPLPIGYTPLAFARTAPAVRRRLARLIDGHDYLHFAIGGAFGDWGAIGALVASCRGRRAAVWTDRVESEVMRQEALRSRGLRRLRRRINARLAVYLERAAISRSALGLFHGKDTWNAYRRFSPRPELVHDIHLKAADRIAPAALAAKLARPADRELRIVYAGRVHADKGPADWVEALRLALAAGLRARATWYGEGPLLDEMRDAAAQAGIADRVRFAGNLSDRAQLLAALRDADVFLFCHRTPESPRCLIEALLSATPILGYGSAYSEDLIERNGGGLLCRLDPAALARRLVGVDGDRAGLSDLMARAAADGHPLIDEEVFRHRSDLIRRYAGRAT